MDRRKVELSNDEYTELIVSDKMLYHIIKIVMHELEWDWDELKLSSRGQSIIKYLALEVKDIAEKLYKDNKELIKDIRDMERYKMF